MVRRRSTTHTPLITLDDSSVLPLYRQVYENLRTAILTNRLTAGMLLPSTRRLAEELGISRMTVVAAYEQLLAEGYLEGRLGSGTYVSNIRPDDLLYAADNGGEKPASPPSARTLSRQGAFFKTATYRRPNRIITPRAFPLGVPAIEAFPLADWRRLSNQCYRSVSNHLLLRSDLAGYQPLREVIADYLTVARAVKCDPSQIVIMTGAQQALDLVARVLLDPGDKVWMENPGYFGAHNAFMGVGASMIPVPVDSEGINIVAGKTLDRSARLIYVTPSHQFPLGMTMSLPRRLALLEYAYQNGAYIVEDDYDSELRYAGRPLPSLQGLDTKAHVLYIGTFSKVLFPSLKIGYLVVPPDMVDTFIMARTITNGQVAIVDQMVLTRFIAEGHFERHIRRTRTLYAERQAALIAHVDLLEGLMEIAPKSAGMHVVGWLSADIEEREVARQASQRGLVTMTLSTLSLQPLARQALILGYTATQAATMREDVHTLAEALRAARTAHSTSIFNM